MADDISRLLEQTCCAFIPEYYDGVLEALRIQQINDAEIEPFVSSIMRLFRNSYIKTADIDYVEELEDGLGIGHEGTFEQRREAIINELNNVFIANDENIITLAMSIFGGDNLEMITDCKRLITIITTALNNEDSMYAVESLKCVYIALAPLLPQNINFGVGVHSSNVINVKYEYGWTTHLHTELGSIEYVEPEPEPEETFTAYSRSASYQNSNQTLQTAVYTSIYEPGSNNVVSGDTHKDYEIIGMWNAAGTELNYDKIGLSCFLVSGNPRIRIYNSSGSTKSWNRIEYKSHDVFKLYTNIDFTDRTFKGSLAANNSNGITTLQRTPNETYTVIGVYMADGTQIPIPADLTVSYQSSLRQLRIAVQYENTFARVDVVITGGDEPTTASALSLNNDEEM